MTLAGLGGFAFGLTLLVWIGGLSLLLPAFPVLAIMFVTRRPQAGALAMGMFLGAACGLFAALVVARPYLSAQTSALHLFGLSAAGFGAVTALVAPLAFVPVRRLARRLLRGRPRFFGLKRKGASLRFPSLASVLGWLMFAAPLVVLAGFAVRPYVQVTRGFTDPYVVRYVTSLQRLARLPVDGHRQYYETSLDWVVWYLGVPAVLLACAGAAVLGRRMILRAAMRGQDPSGPGDSGGSWVSWVSSPSARMWGLTYLVVAWSVVTVLWDPSVLPGQPSASRRLVPVVLPGLVLLGVWAASLLRSRASSFGAGRVTTVAVGLCCAVALVIPAFWSAFAPLVTVRHRASSGLSVSVAWRGVASTKTWTGTVAAVDQLCSAIGPNASVVFTDALTADYFAPAVRGMCGQPAALVLATGSDGSGSADFGPGVPGVSAAGTGAGALGVSDAGGLGSSGPALVAQVVASIERTGRRPVLLGTSESSVGVYGAPAKLAVSLQTRTDPEVLNGPPAGSWPFSYTVWIATASPAGSSTLPGSFPAPGSPTAPGSSTAPAPPASPAVPGSGSSAAPGAPGIPTAPASSSAPASRAPAGA